MSDEEKGPDGLTDVEKQEKAQYTKDLNLKRHEARQDKLVLLKQIRAMKTDTEWNVLEELLQDIMAVHVVNNPNSKQPSVRQLRNEVVTEIKVRHDSDHELRDLLLDGLPTEVSMGKWIKKTKWKEAVWDRVRSDGLFTGERRAIMINALFERGTSKSDNAAKIWLTLSGDYSDKLDVSTDKTLDKYREINEILHKKTKD